jgi:hypothetical protein
MEKIKFRVIGRRECFVILALDLRTFHSFETFLDKVVPYLLFNYISNTQRWLTTPHKLTYSYVFDPLPLDLIEALKKANNLCKR